MFIFQTYLLFAPVKDYDPGKVSHQEIVSRLGRGAKIGALKKGCNNIFQNVEEVSLP